MPTSQRSGMDALRAEVARLSACEAARQRLFAVSRALDRLDRALLAAQFWPDAHVDYGVFYQGRIDGFLDIAMGFQGSMRDTHHLVGNVQLHFEGDELAAESYVHAHHVLQGEQGLAELVVGARYLSRLQHRDGDWRIAYQTEVLDWGRMVPITDSWFDANREMPKGRRDREDASYPFLPAADSNH